MEVKKMADMTISSSVKAKILEKSSKSLREKGIIFVDVVSREEIKNIEILVSVKGEKNIGIFNSKDKNLIGTLFFGNSSYNDIFIPPKIWWTFRLSSPLNEKIALSVRSIIERTAPMIKIRIVAVL